MAEARRVARAAAEKRRTLSAGSGQKLGGVPVRAGTDIRKVIVDAIERRNKTMKGCGASNKTDKEIKDLADQATRNGFRTQAEEDEANDRAIAQAMWELVQEDQKGEYGDSYIPSTPENPTGNAGGARSRQPTQPRGQGQPPIPTASKPSNPTFRQPSRPISRLVVEAESKTPRRPLKQLYPSSTSIPVSTPARTSPPAAITGWTCPVCTLHNPVTYLTCDACTLERPPEITTRISEDERRRNTVSLPSAVDSWECSRCDTVMESRWWTCSTCGKLKESS